MFLVGYMYGNLLQNKQKLNKMSSQGSHLHVIVGHEDGKTAQVVAFAGGVAIPAAQLLAACGGPVPTAVITLPEGTD